MKYVIMRYTWNVR